MLPVFLLPGLQLVGEAEPSEEAVALREQLEEQQQEFNDLLACLGQESAKVGVAVPHSLQNG